VWLGKIEISKCLFENTPLKPSSSAAFTHHRVVSTRLSSPLVSLCTRARPYAPLAAGTGCHLDHRLVLI
jgi:hypothetical protein